MYWQSCQLPNVQGGWGPNRWYIYAKDSDRDRIPDEYEKANPGLGYKIDKSPSAIKADQDRREAWDHGLPEEKYDATTQKGICVRNEGEVNARKHDIEQLDWSDNGMFKDVK